MNRQQRRMYGIPKDETKRVQVAITEYGIQIGVVSNAAGVGSAATVNPRIAWMLGKALMKASLKVRWTSFKTRVMARWTR